MSTRTKPKKVTFSAWERVVNPLAPYAIPALVAVSPAIAPVFKLKDKLFSSGASSERPSNTYKPVVIFSSRAVKDMDVYKKEFASYAKSAQENPGVRMCFSFANKEKESSVLQLSWFDSCEDYVPQPDSLVACYSSRSSSDYTAVFGSYDSKVVDAIKAGGGESAFNDGMGGYLKDPEANGFKTGELPMIWISKRKIKKGMMERCQTSFQKGVNRMFYNAPTAIAIAEFKVGPVLI